MNQEFEQNPYATPASQLQQNPTGAGAPSIEEALARGYDFRIGDVLGEAWHKVKGMKGTLVVAAIIYAVAGWTGMRWVTFLILDAIGTLAWAGMLSGLGWALGQHAVSVAQTVSKYGLWVSIAIVVLVVAGQMRGARLQR